MGDSSSAEQQRQSERPRRNVVLGKYEMGRLLGKGTFAKVYYGKHIVTQDSVAIKVINKDKLKKDGGLMEQIKREISVMRLLRHPNIVELREVLATKGKIFFIMEYVKGGELFAKLVKNGKFKEDSASKYFHQLLTAIDFCHSRGVSHRDLKPENLLLDDNGDLKVSDFGLSALLLPPHHHHQQQLLHTQCGTPAYVAPEVLRKKGYDGAKADIWSCGVILFVLLAGYLPFQDENLMNLYRKVFKADYKFPPWISTEAKRLISKLLVVDPDKRIPISTIMNSWWFRKNPPIALSIVNQEKEEEDSHDDYSWEVELVKSNSKPRFFNAFELISSMSSGFDLSNMFEEENKYGSMFTSKCSATKIVGKLESLAKKLNFGVLSVKDYKVKLQGKSEGRKGKLGVIAEIFEVAPEVVVVELSKSAGDTLEYRKLCDEEIRPSLKDIVWSWQGQNNN